MKLNFYSFIPAAIWFLITIVLFTIPGDRLPKGELFGTPNLDKLVHTFLFFFLCYLVCRPARRSEDRSWKKHFYIKVTLAGVIYGVMIEVVQKYYISNRSFDFLDICADSLGCILSYALSKRVFFLRTYKKIGPDGNRGRNQN